MNKFIRTSPEHYFFALNCLFLNSLFGRSGWGSKFRSNNISKFKNCQCSKLREEKNFFNYLNTQISVFFQFFWFLKFFFIYKIRKFKKEFQLWKFDSFRNCQNLRRILELSNLKINEFFLIKRILKKLSSFEIVCLFDTSH